MLGGENEGLVRDAMSNHRRHRKVGQLSLHGVLRVVYGTQCSVQLTSAPGQGTIARIEIPLAVPEERTTS